MCFLALSGRAIVVKKPASPTGHFLTDSELDNITSIACLEAKQRDPSFRCSNTTALNASEAASAEGGAGSAGVLSPVSYPSYRSSACNSAGDFLCDPEVSPSMTEQERANLTTLMRSRREWDGSLVQCGRLLNDPIDPLHWQPFYLGVAVLPDWPASASNPETLQQLGQLIDAEWNMDQLYVGSPMPSLRCPNTAILMLLPATGQAFLSSSSCEFLCAAYGGGSAVAKASDALRKGEVYDAARVGVEEVYQWLAQLRNSTEAAMEQPTRTADGGTAGDFYLSNLLQRFAFALACVALAGAFALALAVFLVGPGLVVHRGKWDVPP